MMNNIDPQLIVYLSLSIISILVIIFYFISNKLPKGML